MFPDGLFTHSYFTRRYFEDEFYLIGVRYSEPVRWAERPLTTDDALYAQVCTVTGDLVPASYTVWVDGKPFRRGAEYYEPNQHEYDAYLRMLLGL